MKRSGAPSLADPYKLSYVHDYGIGFQDTGGRTQVSPALVGGESTLVMVVPGQSLSGNWSGTVFTPVNTKTENFNFFNGGVYRAQDPLLGCDGVAGNLFTRLADKIITEADYQRVIIAPIGLGGSPFSIWQGSAAERITVLGRRLSAAGLLSADIKICLQQGESDAQLATTEANCETAILAIRSAMTTAGITGPMYVAKSTWANGIPAGGTAVRNACTDVVNGTTIFAGPDTDTLNNTNRDATLIHFNATGAAAAANLWYTALGF